MAYIVNACIAMAYIAMAYIAMAYIVAAYIAMAYMAMGYRAIWPYIIVARTAEPKQPRHRSRRLAATGPEEMVRTYCHN